MNRLLVAFPLYRYIPASAFEAWLRVDKTHVVGTISVEGAYLTLAMQRLVDEALQRDDWDRLVCIEQDMIVPVDGLNRIAEYPADQELDVVGAVYHQHPPPHHVHAYMQTKPPYYSPLSGPALKALINEPGLYPVHGVGMGFTSISRRCLEDWDEGVPMWQPQPPLAGHDLWFCQAAREQGFGVWLDSGLGAGHLTETQIGYAHSQDALEEAGMLTWAEAENAGVV